MWPELMGPGWGEQLLLAIALQGAVIAALSLLCRAACGTKRPEPDAVLELWRRHEHGDLTTQEFRRLRHASQAAAPAARVRRPGYRAVRPPVTAPFPSVSGSRR